MDKLLTDLIKNIIGGADNSINAAFSNLMDLCFNLENQLAQSNGELYMAFSRLKSVIFSMALALIVLKFLKKGFDIYILWTEGESDTPPLTFIVYFIRAVVVLICYGILYNWLILATESFGNSMLTAMDLSIDISITDSLASATIGGIFNAILAIIALILIFILYIQFITRGFEIFILNLGFPIACVGLVQADGGVFKSYFDKVFKSVLTVLIQIVICKISMILIRTGHLIYAVASISTAIKTPKLLQEFTLGGNGGVSNFIVTTSKAIELSGQIKRKLRQSRRLK